MERQAFSCWVPSLEYALEFTNLILGKAFSLIEVVVIDQKGNRVLLPTWIFGNTSFTKAMYQLQIQWQNLLNKPVDYEN